MSAIMIVPTVQNTKVLVPKTAFGGASPTQVITIPTNTYDEITLIAVLRSSIAAVVDDINLRVNNLSTAIYADLNAQISRAAYSQGGNAGFTGELIQGVAGNTAAANVHSVIRATIYGNNHAVNKMMEILMFGQANAATLNSGRSIQNTVVLTTPVTEFDLIMAGGNIMASGYYMVVGENLV